MTTRSISTAGLALGAMLTWSVTVAQAQATGSTARPATPAAQKPAAQKPAAPKPAASSAALMTPAKLKEVAPATFNISFDTSAGTFVVQVTRAWAPRGADRVYNLVKNGFYDGARFFRLIPDFMVQFGINGNPKIQSVWRNATLQDDPVVQSNKRGFVTFAKTGLPNSRSTQLFINFRDNAGLDPQGFAPFGQVISGMEVVDKLNPEYRDRAEQQRIQEEGNAYLATAFPKMDFIKKASIVK